jgi:hypothetical protein
MTKLTLASAAEEIPLLRLWQPTMHLKDRRASFHRLNPSSDDEESSTRDIAFSAMDALLFALLSLGPKAAKEDSRRLNSDVALAVHLGKAVLQLDRSAELLFSQSSSPFAATFLARGTPSVRIPCCNEDGIKNFSTNPPPWSSISVRLQHQVWQAITAGVLPALNDLRIIEDLADPATGLFEASELCRLVGVATLAGQVDIALILSRLPCGAEEKELSKVLQGKGLDPTEWDRLSTELGLPCLIRRSLRDFALDFAWSFSHVRRIHVTGPCKVGKATQLNADVLESLRLTDSRAPWKRLCLQPSERESYLSRGAAVATKPGKTMETVLESQARWAQLKSSKGGSRFARETTKGTSSSIHRRNMVDQHRRRQQPPPRSYRRLQ